MPLTIANKGERIYIDTNVLVYYFYTKQRGDFSAIAKSFLQRVEKAKFEGVISSLTLMELIKSLRELLVKYGHIKDSKTIEEIISKIVSQLYAVNNIHFVEGRPPDFEPATEVEKLYYYVMSHESLKLLQLCKGRISAESDSGEPKHEGLHPLDVLHVVLAKRLNCDKIATFERNFRESASEVVPLILQDRDSVY